MSAETPGQAAERAFKATGSWDDAASAAIAANVNALLNAVGVTMDEVITTVTEATTKREGET